MPPPNECDDLVKEMEMCETTTYFDVETGEDYKPTTPPIAHDPAADGDERG